MTDNEFTGCPHCKRRGCLKCQGYGWVRNREFSEAPRYAAPVVVAPQPAFHPHHVVPYPYRLDHNWTPVFILLGLGIVVSWLFLVIAAFVAIMRGLVWLCFRFPLTMFFLTVFTSTLAGGRGPRRRW
jgi:hypothetical protein